MARRQMKKEIRATYAIVCEGYTEWYYFDYIKSKRRYPFKLKPELPVHSSYRHIFEKAKALLQKEEYSAVFCVFVAILIAFAACIWGLRDEVMEWIGENYVEKDLYRIIPTIVQCCEGMQSWWVCLSTKPCSVKFKEFFDDFGNAVGAIAIVLAVLLVVGAVICFCVSCRK